MILSSLFFPLPILMDNLSFGGEPHPPFYFGFLDDLSVRQESMAMMTAFN